MHVLKQASYMYVYIRQHNLLNLSSVCWTILCTVIYCLEDKFALDETYKVKEVYLTLVGGVNTSGDKRTMLV